MLYSVNYVHVKKDHRVGISGRAKCAEKSFGMSGEKPIIDVLVIYPSLAQKRSGEGSWSGGVPCLFGGGV